MIFCRKGLWKRKHDGTQLWEPAYLVSATKVIQWYLKLKPVALLLYPHYSDLIKLHNDCGFFFNLNLIMVIEIYDQGKASTPQRDGRKRDSGVLEDVLEKHEGEEERMVLL